MKIKAAVAAISGEGPWLGLPSGFVSADSQRALKSEMDSPSLRLSSTQPDAEGTRTVSYPLYLNALVGLVSCCCDMAGAVGRQVSGTYCPDSFT